MSLIWLFGVLEVFDSRQKFDTFSSGDSAKIICEVNSFASNRPADKMCPAKKKTRDNLLEAALIWCPWKGSHRKNYLIKGATFWFNKVTFKKLKIFLKLPC